MLAYRHRLAFQVPQTPAGPFEDDRFLHVPKGGGHVAYPKVTPPDGFCPLYCRIFHASGLKVQPAAFWIERAGTYGFYNSGVIAIGAADVEELSERVWRGFFPNGLAARAATAVAIGGLIYTRESVRRAAIEYLIAHELRHAYHHQRGSALHGVAAENDCDFFAGCVFRALGFDVFLGRRVARALGCTMGTACQHGTPDARDLSFGLGVAAQDAQERRRQRLYSPFARGTLLRLSSA